MSKSASSYDQDNSAFDIDDAPPKDAGGWISWASWLLALGWIAAAGLGSALLIGLDGLTEARPEVLAAAAAGTLLPAFMILFAGAAAREGARARAMAARVAFAAERMLHPSPAAEAAARRLGVSVRGEIAALDRALDQALQKVRDVEAVIARQTLAVDNAAGAAQAGARAMITGLERERAELLQLADDLSNQSGLIGEAISRHTRLIADAARLAEAEVRAADEALDSRLSSFGAAAALISDRTSALTSAAQASAESALRLETALSTALDSLAKATTLTDAARQSAEQATFAANATAGAVRETTARAVEDAKRAAEVIRAEAAAVEREGMAALERLRQAGGSRPAMPADDRQATTARSLHPASAERRAGQSRPGEPGYAESLGAPQARDLRPTTPAPTPTSGEPSRWTWREVLAAIDDEHVERPGARASEPSRTDARTGSDIGRMEPIRSEPPPPATPLEETDKRRDQRFSLHFGGGAAAQPSAPQSPAPGATPQGRDAGMRAMDSGASTPLGGASWVRGGEPERAKPPARGPAILTVMEEVDLFVDEVFSATALDRIATKARSGTQSRRRAVREAAPDAVLRLAQHLDADPSARALAAEFLKTEGARVSELLGRGRATMTSDATRAFLLVDAAFA